MIAGALARQSFLGSNSEDRLRAATVAVVGLGGGGSHVVQQLAHVGIGNLFLCDPDHAEPTNLNRSVGTTHEDTQRSNLKTAITQRLAESINPSLQVRVHTGRWQEAAEELREADIIVGALDGYSERFQLEGAARRSLTPYLDMGMDVHGTAPEFIIAGQLVLSMPGHPCLRCMGLIREDDLTKERYGVAGGNPQVIWPNAILAASAVGIIVQLLTPWQASTRQSILLRYDGNQLTLEHDRGHPHLGFCSHYPLTQIGNPFAIESSNSGAPLEPVTP